MAVLFISCGGGGSNDAISDPIYDPDPVETPKVQSIEISPKSVTLHLGGSYNLNEVKFLKAKVYPEGAEHVFLWSKSDDTYVISWTSLGSDNDSLLLGGPYLTSDTGETDIILEEFHSGLRDTCHVIVTDELVPVEKISFDNVTLDLYEGQSGWLRSITSPSFTNDTLHWATENPDIATVGKDALSMNEFCDVLHGVNVSTSKPGTTNIVATSKGGEVVAKYCLTVKGITDISLDKSDLELYEGQEEKLQVTVAPEGATAKNIKWTSENEEIAKLTVYNWDSNPAYVTGGKTGETNIVATSYDGKVVAKCHVKVKSNNTIDYHPYDDDTQW